MITDFVYDQHYKPNNKHQFSSNNIQGTYYHPENLLNHKNINHNQDVSK
jgi:hypothetical protein